MPDENFCTACGSPLVRKHTEGRERAVCSNCGRTLYKQLIVGAGALIEQDGCLLLLRRTTDPFRGKWNLPAGHVEADEDPAQVVVREAREETGLCVAVDGLFDVFFFADHPQGCGIFLVYKCSVLQGSLQDAERGADPAFFARQDLPSDICGGGHSQAVLAWRDRKQLTRQEKWSQLANAISLRSSQDEVLWSIFGTFWAANAILLVALFTTGKLPEDANVGLVVSTVGVLISLAWGTIQRRALGHVKRHEALMSKLEERLALDRDFAVSTDINQRDYQKFVGNGIRARQVMLACSLVGGALWLLAVFYFLWKKSCI